MVADDSGLERRCSLLGMPNFLPCKYVLHEHEWLDNHKNYVRCHHKVSVFDHLIVVLDMVYFGERNTWYTLIIRIGTMIILIGKLKHPFWAQVQGQLKHSFLARPNAPFAVKRSLHYSFGYTHYSLFSDINEANELKRNFIPSPRVRAAVISTAALSLQRCYLYSAVIFTASAVISTVLLSLQRPLLYLQSCYLYSDSITNIHCILLLDLSCNGTKELFYEFYFCQNSSRLVSVKQFYSNSFNFCTFSIVGTFGIF